LICINLYIKLQAKDQSSITIWFKILLLFQCFKHSLISIVLGSICPLSYVIIQRAPEKTRSGSSLIARIERISSAIKESLG
jgi:hypothetical protein